MVKSDNLDASGMKTLKTDWTVLRVAGSCQSFFSHPSPRVESHRQQEDGHNHEKNANQA